MEREVYEGPPLEELKRRFESIRPEPHELLDAIPFQGGLVGYFGHDVVRLLEHLPNRPPDPFGLPIALLGRFDTVLVFDHAQQRVLLISNHIEGESTAADATARLDTWERLLTARGNSGALRLPAEALEPAATQPPTLDAEQHRRVVERAKEYIRAGDIFQVVLARRWEIEGHVDPLALYRALRVVNPSPYMLILETPKVSVVGASPEMLVRAGKEEFEVRPIAGTRWRGRTADEDKKLEKEMLADPKECAEHVMLVDLGRNDLGRVGAAGSVRVESFMEVEYYSHVMHIVSDVRAKRREDCSALDALFACFPAGTLTGAPKIRALEIIDELEPEARGIYGGAVGYISYSGEMDTCITIRTMVVEPGRTTLTAGGGIVADSDPAYEEQETRNKAAALLQAVAIARHLESSKESEAVGAGGAAS